MNYKIILNTEIKDKDKKWIFKILKTNILINPIGSGGHAYIIPKNTIFKGWNLNIHLWTGIIEKNVSTNKLLVNISGNIFSPVLIIAKLVYNKEKSLLPNHKYNVDIHIMYPKWLSKYIDFNTDKKIQILAGYPYDNEYWATGEILEILDENEPNELNQKEKNEN